MGPNAQSVTVVSVWTGGAFVPYSLPYTTASGLAGGPDLWVGGTRRPATMGNASGIAWYARRNGSDGWDTWELDQGTIVANAEGVTFGADGRAWTGSWAGQGFSGLEDGDWINVFELASGANDSSGLINHSGNLLAMATRRRRRRLGHPVRLGRSAAPRPGVRPHRPGADDQQRTAADAAVVNLVAHPDGPLLVLHDWADAVKVEVLVDPARWRDPAQLDRPARPVPAAWVTGPRCGTPTSSGPT